ncbi:PREDICTED: uncharacterized protein LOC104698858 [Camelina sativa]|uniref:Uncharacterized protein LOC104698858 n=1 Tax=Camelina sativa TaxID=90675 RepID=A0ABM0SKN6_CAMSA|nr:PREDICTED: uncharacterized protein LOC104698858 [Camelina sativa]
MTTRSTKACVSYNLGYVPKQKFEQSYQAPSGPPPGFQLQQVQPDQAPDKEMKTMLQQLLQGQATGSLETVKKLTEMKYMEGKTASTSAPKHGQLPGKAVQNPKKFANAITLRNDEEDFIQDKAQIKDPIKVINDPIESDKQSDHQAIKEPATSKDKSVRCIPPPYKPPLPFPVRFKKQLSEKYKTLFGKQDKDIELWMSLLDAFPLVPHYHKFLKDLVMERTKEVQGMVLLSHECSVIIQKKIVPHKVKDPGLFNLPCLLGPLSFDRCLCELGTSVSLMPLSMAKRLGCTRYKASNISLILVDRIMRLPHGLLEDLPVRIKVVEVPTDFVVLEMDEEPKDPLILGKPFLSTTRAIIDWAKTSP